MESIAFNLWTFVLLAAALHGTGLFVLLIRQTRGERRTQIALAALVLVIVLLLVDYSLMIGGFDGRWPVLGQSLDLCWYLVGPLFYGYIRFFLPGRSRWAPEDALHLLPVLLVLIGTASALFAPEEVRRTIASVPEATTRIFALYFSLLFLQSLAYAYITTTLVREYAQGYRQEAAGATAVHLEGLQRLLLVFWVYTGMMAINVGLLLFTGDYWLELDYLVPLTLAGLVYVLGYLHLRSPEWLLPPLTLPPASAALSPSTETSPEVHRHAERLQALMEDEHPYLNPDLRLTDLADQLGISDRTLSQVFREALSENFYDVVNGHRVEAVKRRLADPSQDHLTVLGIALESGFSSKASFNRVFKQKTAMTPSAYRTSARQAAHLPEDPAFTSAVTNSIQHEHAKENWQ